MMHGQPLSLALPEDFGLGERFWYWRGASGQRYIHSIYQRHLCPPVQGAVYVLVKVAGGVRRAVSVGRFNAEGVMTGPLPAAGQAGEEEIHVHLLSRDEEGARNVVRDLMAAMDFQPSPEVKPYCKPVQLELLAA
jgi:hypothetical protein